MGICNSSSDYAFIRFGVFLICVMNLNHIGETETAMRIISSLY